MKRKTVLCCSIVVLLIIATVIYRQTVGAPVIGTVSGAEWEYLTVEGTEYEVDYSAPVNRSDTGSFIGIATDGTSRFRIYSSKKATNIFIACGNGKGAYIGAQTELA